MKFIVFFGLVALLGYASADCGCLRCAKHLTVIGKTIPVSSCPPTTVICRGPPSPCSTSHTLPIRIQAPIHVAAPAPVEELRYKVVASAPCGTVKVHEPIGIKYDTKVEVPVPVSTTTSTYVNLKPCVDRVVIPAQVGGCGVHQPSCCEEKVYVNPIRTCEEKVYVNPIRTCEEKVYVNPIRTCEEKVYVNPIRGCHKDVYVNPIHESPVYIQPIREEPIYVNPIRHSPVYTTPVCRDEGYHHGASGPGLDWHVTKKIISRYGNSANFQVDGDDLSCTKGKSFVKGRSKREVPFVRHGYKFVMNMLPEFIQEPIKNTVNVLALTHPDRRLQKIYNQPRKLTLKEKLEMQRKRNSALLRERLRNRNIRNNLTRKPYVNDMEAKTFMSSLYHSPKYPGYQRQQGLHSRANFLEENSIPSDNEYYRTYSAFTDPMKKGMKLDYLGETNTALTKIEPKMTDIEKVLLMKKLRKLNENQGRDKRSVYKNYLYRKYNKPLNVKRNPTLFGSSELDLPFYQVKERSSEEMPSYNYNYFDNNPWDEYLRSSQMHFPEKYRYRREGDEYNFLQPFTFADVATENYNTREDFLRDVIREELEKYKVQQQQVQLNQEYFEPFAVEDTSSKSPILNVVTFPMRLVRKFNDITQQAFPVVGSVPKMIVGTKKYFRDFGRNFKKNVLHLTSDLIGDFENIDFGNNMFAEIVNPMRQRRNINGKYIATDSDKYHMRRSKQNEFEQGYSLVFGDNSNNSKDTTRNKRYILQMVDEDELEKYIMEKLGGVFDNSETTSPKESSSLSYPYYLPKLNPAPSEEQNEKKLVLERLKPKIILDNNGRPFLEVNGYKRPLLNMKKTNPNRRRKWRTNNTLKKFRYDSSEEVDSERLSSIIDHAKDHLETNLDSKYSEMPVNTVKEKISQLLLDTDILVHMDFNRYHEIYDDLIALQQMKTSVVQDWKRLIMSKQINDMSFKVMLLEKFKELQYYKDLTLTNIVSALFEDNENIYVAKKLIKMLVRLQKLQCLINQVVANFHDHLYVSSNTETAKEIQYVDILNNLNFANENSRNSMITNLIKDRDSALQKNVVLLGKLKNLLMYETKSHKIEEEANLLWEMKNIEKMQREAIEEIRHRLATGYKIKKELKILFDLLRRYESCEEEQRKLLSKFEQESSEKEDSSEPTVTSGKKRTGLAKKKINLEELKSKYQERLRRRRVLLRKQLKKNNRRHAKKSAGSGSDEDK